MSRSHLGPIPDPADPIPSLPPHLTLFHTIHGLVPGHAQDHTQDHTPEVAHGQDLTPHTTTLSEAVRGQGNARKRRGRERKKERGRKKEREDLGTISVSAGGMGVQKRTVVKVTLKDQREQGTERRSHLKNQCQWSLVLHLQKQNMDRHTSANTRRGASGSTDTGKRWLKCRGARQMGNRKEILKLKDN